ncbi:MAG: hypothetical protein L7W43_10930 [Rubripirellula sp.]|nr:hypothetical protein [Rhodopirellula sp.]MCH1440161.1 hypothetical protein [Rubripirellula sp.]OUX03581.1 MAG: hypothetical protein CBE00_14265 [Planctomycetaceae bacterium TMED240]
MNKDSKSSVPRWFWAVAVVALLWNLMGGMVLLSEVFAKEAMMDSFTEEQKEWSRATSPWIYLVFAVSVLSGLTGSIALLKQRGLAVSCFAVSFVAVVVQMGYTMLIAGGLRVMGPTGAVMPLLVVSLAMVWLFFAKYSDNQGWL